MIDTKDLDMSKEIHKEQIKEYINSKSNRIFSNSNKELFHLLLENVFTISLSANWFITNLDKLKFFFNEDGFNLIDSYLERGGELNIIFVNGSDQLISKFKKLCEKHKSFNFIQKVEINHSQDFITWDNIGYRFSPDPHRLTGVACANDSIFTEKCNNVFNRILNH